MYQSAKLIGGFGTGPGRGQRRSVLSNFWRFAFAVVIFATASGSTGAFQTANHAGATTGTSWKTDSHLDAKQWVGAWLISRDGEARHVWSLKADGTGRSYAFLEHGGEMRFAYGYDIRWYFDPFTQMAHIKTERRIVCRGGKIYPYFLTLKSYESDYAVKDKFTWQTTWTEASIGKNRLHKSQVVFVAALSSWQDPTRGVSCPKFPSLKLERDIDLALDRWEREIQRGADQGAPGEQRSQPEGDADKTLRKAAQRAKSKRVKSR
ncbi:hypothetical protein [Microbulbifer thermotolerans]|uniref:hypothetical protein n=1 Tax=Microbulbifer thermotolerans TaxID=252514 RepID=UPI00224957F8|nr:hypothetical protein [Microbulbifer thermotolerans]MCX2830883.1 hypothetical protein [Microbulbifer thermotolerans]